MKTLANYCLDVRFARPNADDICGRLKLIMEHEGFRHVDLPSLRLLCTSVNNDIRQVLNLLQMLRLTTDRLESARADSFQRSLAEGRTVELSPFAVVPTLFSAAPRTVNETLDLFFKESDLMPLFVAENYIYAHPNVKPEFQMANFANAAEAISMGDLVKEQVMRQQDWSLLPFLGVISTVRGERATEKERKTERERERERVLTLGRLGDPVGVHAGSQRQGGVPVVAGQELQRQQAEAPPQRRPGV